MRTLALYIYSQLQAHRRPLATLAGFGTISVTQASLASFRAGRKNLPLAGSSIIVNSNPYDSPTPARSVAATSSTDRNLVHVAVLGFIFLLTLLFAFINSIGEQLPSISFALGATLASVISQLPGGIVGFFSTRGYSRTIVVFLFPAYFVATTGMLAYLAYAFNGKADSLNSAAHMHVVMFPMFHCFVAVVSYVLAAVVQGVISMVAPKR